MWWYHGDWGWGGWLAMTLGMIAFWGLVIWAVIAVVRSSDAGTRPRVRAPEDILAERLARGEIDEDDYRRRLELLRGETAVDHAGSGTRP